MTSRLIAWADARPAVALDLIRIYLGIGLLVRGLVFLTDPGAYVGLLPGGSESAFASVMVMHYVALAHLGGGLFLAAGLLTRTAALVQIPILLGAVFVIHLPQGLFAADQSFAFSALVLAILSVLAVWGGGPWSLDRAIAARNARQETAEAAVMEENARRVRARPRRSAPVRAAVVGTAACTCGHGRDHPEVDAERSYSGIRRLRFITGTHPRPSAVTFRCRTCGGVVERLEDPEALEAFRYAPEAGI